jgi:hypothetical protein
MNEMRRAIKIGMLSATSVLLMVVLARLADAPGVPMPRTAPEAPAAPQPASQQPAPAPIARAPSTPVTPTRREKMDMEPFRPIRRPIIANLGESEPVGPVPAGAVGGPVPESLKPESERFKPWR